MYPLRDRLSYYGYIFIRFVILPIFGIATAMQSKAKLENGGPNIVDSGNSLKNKNHKFMCSQFFL